MPSRDKGNDRSSLLQGTLDLLILKTLILGPQHGQGIARSIEQRSEGVFLVEHGSLYLALQRLEEKGWLSGAWSVSESNRKAAEQIRDTGAREDVESAARRKFGNVTRLREDLYERGRWLSWDNFLRDFRYASRMARRSPGKGDAKNSRPIHSVFNRIRKLFELLEFLSCKRATTEVLGVDCSSE